MYLPTPHIDSIIAEHYARFIATKERGVTIRVAGLIRWPKWRVCKRASELGLSWVKELPWSEAEIKLITKYAHLHHDRIRLKLKRAGFNRTATAICLKRKRLRLIANVDGYSSRALAECFGIDSHAITRWIKLGYLKAEKRGTERKPVQGGDIWFIRQKHVKAFVFAHPEEIDLRKVEKFWFLDLVTDGKICR